MERLVSACTVNAGRVSQNMQLNTNTITRESQQRKQLQALLLALDRLEVTPIQAANRYRAMVAVVAMMEVA